jgi:hypothetical protein
MKNLRLQLLILILIVFWTSSGVIAQHRPQFIGEVEKLFQEYEPKWKVEQTYVNRGTGFFKEDIVFRNNKVQAAVSIGVWEKIENAREVFKDESVAFDNISGKKTSKSRLPGLGEDSYIWTHSGSSAWPTIRFRKGNVIVEVFAPSVVIAKRFAQYVAGRIQPSDN